MTVKLLHNTPLGIADMAIGKCWAKPKEECDYDRVYRVGNKYKHSSTLEHVSYTFDIDAVSRALLQEIARHRMASISVKSTRYTLKELKDADNLAPFLVSIGDMHMDGMNQEQLKYIQGKLQEGISNDKVKYLLPEAYKTSFVWTINLRSLQNFLSLRTDKSALWEIQNLAWAVYWELPVTHRYMVNEFMKGEREQ